MAIVGAVSVAIVLLPFIVSKVLRTSEPTTEKLSPYECGFEPVGTAPRQFNVRFYLVAILFVILDVEIALLFPWAVELSKMPADSAKIAFISMMSFLVILTIGFLYEWSKGALEWK